jgi:hypothetical protein
MTQREDAVRLGVGAVLDRLEVLLELARYRADLPGWNDLFRDTYARSYAHWQAHALVRLALSEPAERPRHLAGAIASGAAWVGPDAAR